MQNFVKVDAVVKTLGRSLSTYDCSPSSVAEHPLYYWVDGARVPIRDQEQEDQRAQIVRTVAGGRTTA
jgi:hypothetical protein